ncbi:MAG: glycosyltransferase [Bacteroidales bacterium]|jgi:glycosyltransferase involved in cell wall biosynthesis|nr:glycosyltransferase [Bacteroidales bacterium]MDD4058624.1 glycosyltransferase [Bacteroidales bacterium]
MDLSIVIALYNEEESVPELLAWIEKALSSQKLQYEIILIDDGSTDKSWEVIENESKHYETLSAIRFSRNYGKSAALFTGFEAAKGEVVVTMDADLQDSPEEIPELYEMIINQGYDLVSGWKKRRKDNKLAKNLPSKLYNRVARRVTGLKLHDMNCGLKAYRKEVIKNVEVYGEMHRYIPYLAKIAGFRNIGEKVVKHQARKFGKSKFGMDRFVNGFLDLITLWFLSKFGKRPMHFFGTFGTLTFFVGFATAAYLVTDKLISQANGLKFRQVADQPLFYISLVALIIGMQLFLAGFVGELVSRNSTERNNYKIKERLKKGTPNE